jgi:carboxymethylenebutenolidase
MCELDDFQEDNLKKYSRRDVGALAAAVSLAAMLPRAAHAVDVKESDVTIKTPDGECDAYFVTPTTGAHAAVLVWPDIFGLRPAFRQMGKRLAEEGYSVLTVNPFYRMKKAPTASQGAKTPFPEVMPQMQSLTAATNTTDAKAFIAWLDQQPQVDKNKKIGTTGYCMGGFIVLRTAAAVPNRVGAGATFHGAALVTKAPDSPHLLIPQMKASFLIAVAENDDKTDPEAKNTLKKAFDAAKLKSEVEVYPAAHGWCPPDTQVYNMEAAEKAWGRMLALFKTSLA